VYEETEMIKAKKMTLLMLVPPLLTVAALAWVNGLVMM